MYKVLIVDDEQPVIDSISFIIGKHLPEFSVSGTAKSGREAIEKAKTARPDIVLIDIMMPGVNGLDAIREIEDFDPDILFIIISAYERFDIARTAFDLGVHNYILKPFNQKKVIESLRSAGKRLLDRHLGMESGLDMMEKVRSVLPKIEQNFIDSLLLGSFDRNLWNLFRELSLVPRTEKGRVFVLRIRNRKESRSRRIIGRIKYKYACIAGFDSASRLVFLFPAAKDEGDGPDDEYWTDVLRSCGIPEEEAAVFRGEAVALDRVYLSYYDALHPLYEGTPKSEEYRKTVRDLLDALEKQDEKGIRRIHGKLFQGWTDCKDEIETRCVLTEVISVVSRETGMYPAATAELILRTGEKDLFSYSLALLLDMVKKMNQHREKDLPDILIKAEEYIETHFNNPIQLTDVAEELNISAPYLSQLFSRYMDTKFIDYLTDIRINRARTLLSEPNASVKEVSALVGYQDPNYFSRIYKKHTGYTPTEFIENHQYNMEGFSANDESGQN